MRGHKRKAISTIFAVFVVLTMIVVIVTGVLVYGETQFGWFSNNDGRLIQATGLTFTATTSTLNFTLTNPFPTEQTVSSVKVNQTFCNANFAPLKANVATPESCVVSRAASFTKGEAINFTMNFANGQSITGSVYAQ
jgi:hypothetical protein